MRGATRQAGRLFVGGRLISTHAPLAGRDFYNQNERHHTRISTHAPLAGRDPYRWSLFVDFEISTHAPLAGRDGYSFPARLGGVDISTHAPLAGRDGAGSTAYGGDSIFQPTRPLRGATKYFVKGARTHGNFNPRAPCGARQNRAKLHNTILYFNPRAPCGARRFLALCFFVWF